MHFLWVLLFFSISAWSATAPLSVSNRTPASGEIGYLPADSAMVEMNPPSLVWLHERPASNYTVEISRYKTFHNSILVSNLSFNCYTHDAPLPEGFWWWRYRFTDAKGKQSTWSAVRQFKVDGTATPFPLPSKAERVQRIPAGHPRLFVRPETLPVLREAASNGLAAEFARLRTSAEKLLAAKLVEEPKAPGTAANKTNRVQLENWWANRTQTMRACTEAETVAFVYLVTGEKKFGVEARRRLLDLASWDPSKETNFRRNCEAAKPLLHRIARVYDWCYPELSEADKKKVHAAVTQRIADAWASGEVGRGTGHINSPFSSHGNRTFHKIGESGIVFLGEIPEAEQWLDFALNKFYAVYPVWADADGGWHEGLAYWAGYMSKIVWWLDAMDVALQIDGFKKPFFSHVGDFGLYVAPPNSPNMGFSDLSFRAGCSGWGYFVDYFNRRAEEHKMPNGGYWRWWADSWKMQGPDGVLGFLYKARMPTLPETRRPVDLPKSKVFTGTGIASFHTDLEDSTQDVHFLFKASPFGTSSHGFNAQNGFLLNAFGESLLPACTYRDWYGTDFHYKWVHETISQNAILVNGKGQLVHDRKAKAQIADSLFTDSYSYVVGDATPAYAGRLTRSLRHVVFLKDTGAIVLFDELTAPNPATYQVMLHGLSEFTVDAPAQKLHLQQPKAGLTVLYLASEPLSLRQWDGFNPKPMREFPNHWHVEASTPGKQSDLSLVTVLLPHKGTEPLPATARRIETMSALGVELNLAGKKSVVAIRKASSSGTWTLDGKQISEPVFVQ